MIHTYQPQRATWTPGQPRRAKRSVRAKGAALVVRRHLRRRAANSGAVPLAMGELALSFKPPKVLRNLVSSAAKAVGIKATVPTPAGPIVVDTRDPDTLKRAADAARDLFSRTTVTVGPRDQATAAAPANFVESSVPGGWLTVGVLGVGGLIVLKKVLS